MMLIRKCALFAIGILVAMAISATLQADWSKHPLWVGYAATADGRDPKLSGIIDKKFISQFLPENPVIVDAGAYDGSDTLEMARQWPTSTLYAFEAVPEIFNRLQSKCKDISNIFTYSLALSDKVGSQTLYISEGQGDGASSLLPPDSGMTNFHPDITFAKAIEVQSTTLDHWAASKNITTIDFLWFDLQGMEPVILKSSPNILKTIKVIFTEVSLRSTYQDSVLYPEYKKWLESEGFQVVREDLPWVDGGNVLFVRKSYLEQLKNKV